MITTTQNSRTAPVALKLKPAGQPAVKKPSESFDKQLSQALSDSLGRLGVKPGEINISIRNAAGSLTARQILITYGGPDSPGPVAPGTTTPTPANEVPALPVDTPAPETRLNPFTMDVYGGKPTEAIASDEPTETKWSPWNGPRDRRDSIPAGGGKLTSSGSPDIQLNATPARNQYNYAGPGSMNPYFTNPGNPLREGYVLGFGKWFEEAMITGMNGGPAPANKILYASADGATEALRLVQQQIPGAELIQQTWGNGPFMANRPMYLVKLPDGGLMNAGGILQSYYSGGSGVTTAADADLQRMMGTAVVS